MTRKRARRSSGVSASGIAGRGAGASKSGGIVGSEAHREVGVRLQGRRSRTGEPSSLLSTEHGIGELKAAKLPDYKSPVALSLMPFASTG